MYLNRSVADQGRMSMYDYDDDYGDEGGRSLGQTLAIAIGVIAVVALGWFSSGRG